MCLFHSPTKAFITGKRWTRPHKSRLRTKKSQNSHETKAWGFFLLFITVTDEEVQISGLSNVFESYNLKIWGGVLAERTFRRFLFLGCRIFSGIFSPFFLLTSVGAKCPEKCFFRGFLLLGRRIFWAFGPPDFFGDFLAFSSPHFCGGKVPREFFQELPSKILHSLYNKNPRQVSAEGPGQKIRCANWGHCKDKWIYKGYL